MIARAVGFAALALSALLAAAPSAARSPAAPGSSGTLTIIGSDTLSALELRWADAFRARHPGAAIQVQAPGSASAPVALIEGAADIGAMSRPMNDDEVARFRNRYGYAPARIVVARDAIVVFVHPDNPLRAIDRDALDAAFSATRRCGAANAATTWRDLGVSAPEFADLPILPIGRNSASGTHEFFRESALCGGDYRADVVVWPGHGATVDAVARNRNAIGYAGIGYVNGRVRTLALDDGHGAVAPTRENVIDGVYPLARPLYFYFNRPPGRPLAALPAAFLAYALSDPAQAIVDQEGLLRVASTERDAGLDLVRGAQR